MRAISRPVLQSWDAIIGKALHRDAAARIAQHVDDLTSTLILESKTQAHREQAEMVLTAHVEQAFDHIIRQRKRDWLREGLKIVGGAMVGGFVPGLMISLAANDTGATVIFIGLGFAGMLMVFLGIFT